MDSAQLPAPQLGRILVAAGLLTEAQLAQALEEQTRTGRRLGEIIVRRGFVSGPALANALAEQHGGLLKTEYGFATGLGGQVAQKAATEAHSDVQAVSPMPLLRTVEPPPPAPEPQAGEGEPEQAPEAVAEQLPHAIAPVEPAPSPEPEPEAAPVVELAPTPPPAPAPPPPELVQTPDPEPESEPEPEPEPEVVAVAPPVPEPDERDALIESLRARIDAQDAELARLQQTLADERARSNVQVDARPEGEPVELVEPAPAPSPVHSAQQEHYLVCVPTSSGYVLFDRIGVVPSIGQPVQVPEEAGEFTVTKVVRLPRNGRPCAYLQRA